MIVDDDVDEDGEVDEGVKRQRNAPYCLNGT